MKKSSLNSFLVVTVLASAAAIVSLPSCKKDMTPVLQARVDSLQSILKTYNAEKAQVETRLARFDSLDFDVYSNQKWDQLSVSHADDIVVNWPDGHSTKGLAQHIEDLKMMFVFAPDTKITAHPVRFGSGDWTCATGVMTGTFSKPMPMGGGKTIKPTGRKFSIPLCTVGHWKGGKMIEESLFWDNQAFMKQIGLAK